MTKGDGTVHGLSWPRESLLGQLSPSPLTAITVLGSEVTIPAGERFLKQGEDGAHAVLLLSGCVKVTGNEAGREPLLGIRVAGDLVGEMGALSRSPRSASVTSCTPISAQRISAAHLRQYLLQFPEAALCLLSSIADRLRWADDRRVDFASLGSATRVARVLLALSDDYGRDSNEGRDLGVALTQEEIASIAGVRLATSEKALRNLQKDGVITVRYRRIVIKNRADLDRAATAYE